MSGGLLAFSLICVFRPVTKLLSCLMSVLDNIILSIFCSISEVASQARILAGVVVFRVGVAMLIGRGCAPSCYALAFVCVQYTVASSVMSHDTFAGIVHCSVTLISNDVM